MTRRLSQEYAKAGKQAWADELKRDSDTMIKWMQKEVIPCDDGGI